MQSLLNDPDTTETWTRIAPLLDDALDKLGAKDRDALALRFFENKSLAEVGAALGASEDAAKMRVNRALEKLRKTFTKRGVTLSAALIAGAVSANSVQAAPVSLAKTISVVAFAKGAAAGGSTLALVKGALKLMAWTKAKMVVAIGVTVLLTVGTVTVVVEKSSAQKRQKDSTSAVADTYPGNWIWDGGSETLDRVPPIFLLQPSTMPANFVPRDIFGKDRYRARGKTAKELISTVWSQKNSALKIIFAADLPEDKLDFIVAAQPHWWDKLESEINKRFNLVEQIETRDAKEVVIVKTAGTP